MSWKQNRLFVPKFRKDNYLKTAEFPRWNGELKSVTISKKASKYYASCLFELDMVPVQYKRHKKKTDKVGIDLGVKTLAIMSDGSISTKVDTKKIDNKIKKRQRNLARKQSGSKNLSAIQEKTALRMGSLSGGSRDNVIPSQARADIWVEKAESAHLAIEEMVQVLQAIKD